MAKHKPLALAVLAAALIAGGVFLHRQGTTDRPVSSDVVSRYLREYAASLEQVYYAAANKARAGEFRDLGMAQIFVGEGLTAARELSFDATIRPELEKLNGDGWDNERAANAFAELARGWGAFK